MICPYCNKEMEIDGVKYVNDNLMKIDYHCKICEHKDYKLKK